LRRMDQILECSGVRKTQEKLKEKLRTVTFSEALSAAGKTQDSHFLAESAQSLVHQRQHPLNFSGCRVEGALR